MIHVTMEIGKLFTAIEDFEKCNIKENIEYFQTTNINITDENLKYINVNGLYKKTDTIVTIKFSDGNYVKVANKHSICIDKITHECVTVDKLNIGDVIPTTDNINKIISDIIVGDVDYVFDMEVDSDNHLYSTPDGIIHHNTMLSTNYALDSYFNREIDKIHLVRPMVGTEEMGFLPGNIQEKLDPWLVPIHDNFKKCYGSSVAKKNALKNMIDNEDITVSPLAFMRGRNFENSCVIVDEAQNITIEQAMMIVGRICKGTKIIFCGDYRQVDLKRKSDSGLEFLIKCGEGISGFATVELVSNHRHPILDQFMDRFDEYQSNHKK